MAYTRFSLPVEGRWFVMWGGDTKELNLHHGDPVQNYAFDLIGAEDKESSDDNKDYAAFNSKVFTPADGEVIEAVEGVRDNIPMYTNVLSAAGNYVLIKHNMILYSFLAHLKQGSLKVKVGEKVKRGDLLGFSGNSGNSSQPHLHFHLQDSADFYRFKSDGKLQPMGKGVKCYFDSLTVEHDGKKIQQENYSPIRGDIISRV